MITIVTIIIGIIIIIRRAFGPRRVRTRPQPWAVLFCSLLLCEWALPRALGGQSRSHVDALTSPQSPARPCRLHWLDGFFRRIQDSPLKCRDSSRRSTSIFETAFFKKVSNLKTFWGNFLALSDGATAPCKNAVNRACGHLGGPLGFSKLFPGASSGTRGASREGKKFRLGSFDPALVLKTDRLHFCNGLWRPGPSHTVNMQSIWPSHGAL